MEPGINKEMPSVSFSVKGVLFIYLIIFLNTIVIARKRREKLPLVLFLLGILPLIDGSMYLFANITCKKSNLGIFISS